MVIVIGIALLLEVVLELLDIRLGILKRYLELLDLIEETLLDISALCNQAVSSFTDLLWDALDLVEGDLENLLNLVIDVELGVLVHELDPFDERGVFFDNPSLRRVSELLELLLVDD